MLLFLLFTAIRDERALEYRRGLARVRSSAVLRLRDVLRCAVRLAPTLNGARIQSVKVQRAFGVDPAHGARIAEEDLVFVDLT